MRKPKIPPRQPLPQARSGSTEDAPPEDEWSRKGLLSRAALLAGGVVAGGFAGNARAEPTSRGGVRWNAAKGAFQAEFVSTSPSSAADNLIQPTANIVPLTVKGFEDVAATATLDIYGYRNPNTPGEDKVIRFFSPNYTFWNPEDPQAYFNATGGFRTMRDILVSGYRANGGTEDFVISRPTPDPGMVWIWSDVSHSEGGQAGCLQLRANNTGPYPDPNAGLTIGNSLLSGLDRDASYVFLIGEDGAHWWGPRVDGGGGLATQLDTNWFRATAKTLKTVGGIIVTAPAVGGPARSLELQTSGGQPAWCVNPDGSQLVEPQGDDLTALTLRLSRGAEARALTIKDLANVDRIYFTALGQRFAGDGVIEGGDGLYFDPNKTGSGHPIKFRQSFGRSVLLNSDGTFSFENWIGFDTTNGGSGIKFGTARNQKLAFFDATPVVQRPSHGPLTAGSGYGSRERNMLNDVYSGLRALGLLA